jgi:hypothetical protein
VFDGAASWIKGIVRHLMDSKLRRALKFESLEDRVFRSDSAHLIAAARTAHFNAHSTALTGTLRIVLPTSDPGTDSIEGTGNVRPLGAVSYSGIANVTAPEETGSGELTLSGQKGSLSLHIDIGPMRGALGLNSTTFTVIGGSGADANSSGHGPLSFEVVGMKLQRRLQLS